MVREIGDDVSGADLDQTILHELRLDEQIRINGFEFRQQSAADQPIEVRSCD
jgi:hypothetical protein